VGLTSFSEADDQPIALDGKSDESPEDGQKPGKAARKEKEPAEAPGG
jgi:hypothetical protein